MVFALERLRLWWSGAFWVVPLLGVLGGWLAEVAVTRLDELTRIRFTGVFSPAAAQSLLAAVGAAW